VSEQRERARNLEDDPVGWVAGFHDIEIADDGVGGARICLSG
jgi:hypothetical protein